MTRKWTVSGVAAALVISGMSLSAHDKYRIIGTVVNVTATIVDVKQAKDGKTITMDITDKTVVTRDKKNVGRGELKAGVRVVADALGDSLEELEAVEVTIVPAPTRR